MQVGCDSHGSCVYTGLYSCCAAVSPLGEACPPERRRLDHASSPWPVASAAPRAGPRPSRHVFADGAHVAAGRHRLLGNLPGVPHVGHPRALLFERAVGGLPARVPRLRVERAGLAPRRAGRIARVGGRRRIDEVANGGGVQDVGAVIEIDQVRQGFRLELLVKY